MSQSYEISTLKDIYEKVPSDRIQECCKELGLLLAQTKAMVELIGTASEAMAGQPLAATVVKIPDVFIWVDDGKGEITSSFSFRQNGEVKELLRMETKRGAAK